MKHTYRLACPHASSTPCALQGRRQEAHEFFRAMAEGSLQPLSPSGDAVALLMHDLLQHGDASAAVGFFQALPRMPVRPPPSPALVSAAVDAFSACGRWSEAASALASGARNAAASPTAAVGLMCNIARAAAALPQDAPQTAELLSTAYEARPSPSLAPVWHSNCSKRPFPWPWDVRRMACTVACEAHGARAWW